MLCIAVQEHMINNQNNKVSWRWTRLNASHWSVPSAGGNRGLNSNSIHLPQNGDWAKQLSLRWRTVCLVAGVGTICLHREVAGGDPDRRTALPYWAETAGWRAGGVGGWVDGPQSRNHQGLWERLRQRRGAARVPARGGPDGPVRSVGGVGKHGSAGRGDAHLWLAESVARGFLQTLHSLLRGHRDDCVLIMMIKLHQKINFLMNVQSKALK